MVALTLGIVILLGVTQVFSSNSRTRGEIEKTGRQIENGIYALRLMEDELSNAGYWGEAGAQTPGAMPKLCPTSNAELMSSLGYPVQGELASGEANCATPKAATDFLAIRRASTCATGSTGCDALNAADVYLQVNSCFDPDDPSVPFPGIVTLAAGSDIDELDDLTRQCDTSQLAPIYQFLSRVYYVTSSDILTREELSGGSYVATALVDGIEILRFEYGVDADDDAQVDDYTDMPAAGDWSNVIAVKVSLVARSLEPTAGYTDNKTYTVGGESYTVPADLVRYKRQVYSRTVYLRNVGGRRELP
jgi:type IV pilus assembly protein PilW